MAETGEPPASAKVGLRAALAGAALAAVVVAVVLAAAPSRVTGEPFIEQLPRDGRIPSVLSRGDGQATYLVATNPALRDPVDPGARQELAYRGQRPLFAYAAWLVSAGRTAWLPEAIVLVSVAAASLLVAAFALLLADRGAGGRWAPAVLAVPGVTAGLAWLNIEPLAIGLAALGVAQWRRRPGWAALALTAAVLTRETLVLVPAALAAWEAVVGRRLGGRRLGRIALLAAPVAAWAAWVAFVHERVEAWPWDAAHIGRLAMPTTTLPLLDATDVAIILVTVLLAGAAVRRRPGDPVAWCAVGAALIAVFLGPTVWAEEGRGVLRLLAPAHAFAGVALAAPRPPITSSRR